MLEKQAVFSADINLKGNTIAFKQHLTFRFFVKHIYHTSESEIKSKLRCKQKKRD